MWKGNQRHQGGRANNRPNNNRNVANSNANHNNNRGGGNANGNTIQSTSNEPYNFISLPDSVQVAYQSFADIPKHNVYNQELNTGTITFKATCKTPMFIAGKNGGPGEEDEFVKNAEGKKIVPGSTLRGLIRTNFEILSKSYPKFIQNRHLSHRGLYTSVQALTDLDTKHFADGSLKAGLLKNEGGKWKVQVYGNVKHCTLDGKNCQCKVDPTAPWRDVDATSAEVVSSPIMTKTHKFILSNLTDEIFDIPQNIIEDFKYDYETRKHLLKDKNFYKLQDNIPVFFRLKNGEVTDFGVVRRYRMAYDKSICECGVSQLQNSSNQGVDYANAVFGWIGANTDKKSGDEAQWGYPSGEFAKHSYKGRVSFEDTVIEEEGNASKFSGVLGSPSPKWCPGYLEQTGSGDGTNKAVTYNTKNAKIRGNKFYWGRISVAQGNQGNGNENVGTKFTPVGIGSNFTATIHFENLSDKELGLLLQSIKLSRNVIGQQYDNQFQLIGKAKPYGYGRVQISDLNVTFEKIDKGLDVQICKKTDEELDSFYNESCVNSDDARVKQYIKSKTVLNDVAQYLGVKEQIRGRDGRMGPNFAAYKTTVLEGMD